MAQLNIAKRLLTAPATEQPERRCQYEPIETLFISPRTAPDFVLVKPAVVCSTRSRRVGVH